MAEKLHSYRGIRCLGANPDVAIRIVAKFKINIAVCECGILPKWDVANRQGMIAPLHDFKTAAQNSVV
ncbi:hypothetical protein D3C85_1929090 [compost metagenome]